MLDPNARSLLTDALTPPPGMHFDAGLATTYSLDPTALLTVPIHLAWLASGQDKNLLADPIRMLEALRRVASRLTVFCQRGRMQAPSRPHVLYGLLEQMLHESVAPFGGSFHAKLWLLRYVSDQATASPQLRLIVQSRNLTFDRSWDISLKLDGAPSGTNRRRNIPLGKLLDVLQTREVCTKQMSRSRKNSVESLIADAKQADWDPPDGFEDLRFHALGLDTKHWLPEPSRELAVISPFVRADALKRLAATTERPRLLIARSEELESVSTDVLQLFESTRILAEQAASGDTEDDQAAGEQGLHAKVYIQQRGWGGSDTHIILGSANATDRVVTPGISARSLELLVELIGKRRNVGSIDDLFAKDGFGDLLVDYSSAPPSEVDHERIDSEKMLERVRAQLAAVVWQIQCTAMNEHWSLSLSADREAEVEAVEVRVWPLSVSFERSVPSKFSTPTHGTELGTFATEEVTALLGFHLKTGAYEVRFAIEASVQGMPADRDDAVTRLIIRNREGFVRYLLLLLGNLAGESGGVDLGNGLWSGMGFADSSAPPLFDLLASAYARDSKNVVPIARLIRRLADGEGQSVVPEDFLRMWRVFEEALKKDGIHVDTL